MALRTKVVHRNKEDSLSLYGLGAGPILISFLVTLLLAGTVGIVKALFVGGVSLAISYALLANRPPMWVTYGLLFLLRRRTVLIAATPPSARVEKVLREAKDAYESTNQSHSS